MRSAWGGWATAASGCAIPTVCASAAPTASSTASAQTTSSASRRRCCTARQVRCAARCSCVLPACSRPCRDQSVAVYVSVTRARAARPFFLPGTLLSLGYILPGHRAPVTPQHSTITALLRSAAACYTTYWYRTITLTLTRPLIALSDSTPPLGPFFDLNANKQSRTHIHTRLPGPHVRHDHQRQGGG